MNIPLKKRFTDWIAEQVHSGRYSTEIEAVEDALAEKIENDDAVFFRERLIRSREDIRNGETVAADESFFGELRDGIRRGEKSRGK